MEETVVKKKSPKFLVILILTLVVVIGGSVSAFLLVNKSPKVQYFLAEKETFEEMSNLAKERYQNEVNWIDVQWEKPVETKYDLSAEWNDPNVNAEMQELQSIINSVTLSMKSVHDPVKKELEAGFSGELGSMSVDFGSLYATTEKLVASLSFMEELIRFDDKDFGKLMREIDENFEGNENLGLSQLFEGRTIIPEELRTHIEKEYITYFINNIPEQAFTSEKEEIIVFDKKSKAQKISMNLSEAEVKTLLKDLFEKAKTDTKLKEMMKEELGISSFASDFSASDLTMVIEEFEIAMDAAIEGVDSMSIPNGLQSTIWLHADQIVQREFVMAIGADVENLVTIQVDGTQLLEKTNQQWAYKVGVTDSFGDERVVKIKGDLAWKDQQAEDAISIAMDEKKVFYKGKEELKDNKRTFSRSFGFTDGDIDPAVVWKGTLNGALQGGNQ